MLSPIKPLILNLVATCAAFSRSSDAEDEASITAEMMPAKGDSRSTCFERQDTRSIFQVGDPLQCRLKPCLSLPALFGYPVKPLEFEGVSSMSLN